MKNFDEVFKPNTSSPNPAPSAAAAEVDLGVERPAEVVNQQADECEVPPALSQEAFEKKYPSVGATFTCNMAGQTITCKFVDGTLWMTSESKTRLVGVQSTNPSPIFMYAGGTWLGDSAKAIGLKSVISVSQDPLLVDPWWSGTGFP